jgi:hypothetical protein
LPTAARCRFVTAVLGGEIDAACRPISRKCIPPRRSPSPRPSESISCPACRPPRGAASPTWHRALSPALAAPAGTPPEIVCQDEPDLDAFLKTDEAKKQFAMLGARPLGGPPERLTERMNQEKALWGPIVKSADIKLQ